MTVWTDREPLGTKKECPWNSRTSQRAKKSFSGLVAVARCDNNYWHTAWNLKLGFNMYSGVWNRILLFLPNWLLSIPIPSVLRIPFRASWNFSCLRKHSFFFILEEGKLASWKFQGRVYFQQHVSSPNATEVCLYWKKDPDGCFWKRPNSHRSPLSLCPYLYDLGSWEDAVKEMTCGSVFWLDLGGFDIMFRTPTKMIDWRRSQESRSPKALMNTTFTFMFHRGKDDSLTGPLTPSGDRPVSGQK